MYEAKYQKYITKSNSRFSEPEEILAHARPLTNTFGKTASGIPLYYSSDETLYVDNEDNHLKLSIKDIDYKNDGSKLERMEETKNGFKPLKDNLEIWITEKIKEITNKM